MFFFCKIAARSASDIPTVILGVISSSGSDFKPVVPFPEFPEFSCAEGVDFSSFCGILLLEDLPLIVANHLYSWLLTCGKSSFSYFTSTPCLASVFRT